MIPARSARIIGLLFGLAWLSAPQISAAPGWEGGRLIGPKQSRWPEVRTFNRTPWFSYVASEDGLSVLKILSYTNVAWSLPLGPSGEWQYDFAVLASGRPFVVATAASDLLRLTVAPDGTVATDRSLPAGAHSPRLYLAGDRVMEFYDVPADNRHRLFMNAFSATDLGRFPSAPRPVAPELGGTNFQGIFFPSCAVSSNRILLVFVLRTEDANRRTDTVWQTLSTNYGRSWLPASRSSGAGLDAQYPCASAAGRRFLVSFLQTFSNREQRLVTLTSTNRGAGFDRIIHTNFPFPAYFTRTFLRPDGIHLTGYDYSLNQRSTLFHRVFDPGLRIWGDADRLTAADHNAWNCGVAWSDRKIWTVWENERPEIWFTENDTSCAAPVVFSPDIDTNWENSKSSPVIQWLEPPDISGIRSFAYLLDNSPGSVPDLENVEGSATSRAFSDLSDGRWYFHLRAVDGRGNWSATAHFGFTVNSSPLASPVISSPTHPEFTPVGERGAVFEWSLAGEKRKIAGYSYLLTQVKTREPDDKILTTRTTVKFNRLGAGVWYFYVKAADQNGLWSPYNLFTISILEQEKRKTPGSLAGSEGLVSEENESAVGYTVGHGEVLSGVIRRALGLAPNEDPNDYLKEIVRFNHIQDPDRLNAGDKILFPVIIVKGDMSLDGFTTAVYGSTAMKSRIIVLGKTGADGVRTGDKVILKDTYFLRTGRTRPPEDSATGTESGTVPQPPEAPLPEQSTNATPPP